MKPIFKIQKWQLLKASGCEGNVVLSCGDFVAIGKRAFAGKSNRISFYPQNIARSILQNNACSVIVAHNHPSGNCYPSETDLQTTRVLKNYLDQLELKLVDHLLITRFAHLSLLNRIGCIFKNYSSQVYDPDRFDSRCHESPVAFQEENRGDKEVSF